MRGKTSRWDLQAVSDPPAGHSETVAEGDDQSRSSSGVERETESQSGKRKNDAGAELGAGPSDGGQVISHGEPARKRSKIKKRSRWDEEAPGPSHARAEDADTNVSKQPHFSGRTPLDFVGGTSNLDLTQMTAEQLRDMRQRAQVSRANRPWTQESIARLNLPGVDEGFEVFEPAGLSPLPERDEEREEVQTLRAAVAAAEAEAGNEDDVVFQGDSEDGHERDGFFIAKDDGVSRTARAAGVDAGNLQPANSSLPMLKPEDRPYFGALLDASPLDDVLSGPSASGVGGKLVVPGMTSEEVKERKIMALLLKIKNGTPPMRKFALKNIVDNARSFGPSALFGQILPLLMNPAMEDQERHLLVKTVDRVLQRLQETVRPFTHKILVVIEPLLLDSDRVARLEGREIIANLAKAAGLATMIATMRPDIDSPDEDVRNLTARAFAVVAQALGVPALLPFIRAVCSARISWQARHTGTKIVMQIALLMGCGVLPHLGAMVDIISPGLDDDQPKVRTITALALGALAEASAPYGIGCFEDVLRPLFYGSKEHHGKTLAAFLKAIGFVISLMDERFASYYTKELMPTLVREFASPDDDMKKVVLKVVEQCVMTEGVGPVYIRSALLPEFFTRFWVRRMALDRRNHRQLVETTVSIARRVGVKDVMSRLVDHLKDQSELFRRMVAECVDLVIAELGASELDSDDEEKLIECLLYAFQEDVSGGLDQVAVGQQPQSKTILKAFTTVMNALDIRMKPYLPQIASIIKWRLNTHSAIVRQQACELTARMAPVVSSCGEDALLGHLGVVLYENLGEEFPDVLASVLGALKAIVSVVGMTKMTPPIRDLVPRLTPILKNRNEKVQEQVIDLVGRVADRGAEYVSAREWMRISFDLLELLKAFKKVIRRAAVNTFGYIAKAVGPSDVLITLLNNLKVQERQNRVCTTVAIAIVAETCAPFTVLPALMNEYRVPEINVQNGVLKALSFMFEYIGEMGRDYIYAITPLLEDALVDRDMVHRQTACAVVKHISLGVYGLGCEDALVHLLNFVWPNIFEESPHVIRAVTEAIEALGFSLGPGVMIHYLMAGLFHPARLVRNIYWQLFNTVYINHQDALVASYPSLPDPRERASEALRQLQTDAVQDKLHGTRDQSVAITPDFLLNHPTGGKNQANDEHQSTYDRIELDFFV